MQVILREDVPNLGRCGDVVKVKPGFARNYLLPQSLAVEATVRNLRQLEHQKRVISKRAEKKRAEAQTLAQKLEGLAVTVAVPVGEGEKLYGSVTARDIAKAIMDEGVRDIDRKKIGLAEPIRQLGVYDVPIKIATETTVQVKVWVVAR